MENRYKLLKDLPDLNAGAIFQFEDQSHDECLDGYYWHRKGDRQWQYDNIKLVENNPRWFEEVKERIELQIISGGIYGKDSGGMTLSMNETELRLFEKALNGELYEKDDLIKKLMALYVKRMGFERRSGRETIRFIAGYLGVSTQEWHQFKQAEKTKITTCTPEEMDEVMSGKEKVYSKTEIIKVVNAWIKNDNIHHIILENENETHFTQGQTIDSFKEFINK